MQSPSKISRFDAGTVTEPDFPGELARIKALIGDRRLGDAFEAATALSGAAPGHRDALYLVAVCQRLLRRLPEALASLVLLERQHPRYGLLYQERGYCLVNLGQVASAIEAFAHAVELNPTLLASWDILDLLHCKAGDDVRAAAVARQAAALRSLPTELIETGHLVSKGDFATKASLRSFPVSTYGVEATHLLARIRWKQGELDVAADLFSALIDYKPDDRNARQERAGLNLERRDYPEALADIEALLVADPYSAFLRMLQAGAWAGLGDHDRAISAYRTLLETDPSRPEMLLLLGHSLKAVGRQSEAIAAYRAAATARPAFGDAWWSLANLKTWHFASGDVAQMRAEEENLTTTNVDRLHLCFALGKALDDDGDYAASWQYYLRGNCLRRTESHYRPEITEAVTSRQIANCTAAFLARRSGSGTPSADPIFVVGLPRSGSTLVEQILASHSHVEGTQELPTLPRIAAELGGGYADPLRSSYPEVLDSLDQDHFRRLGERYLELTHTFRDGRPRFVDKMPNNFRHIGLIHLILPNARIIDVRRDPMACCVANLRQLFAGGQDFTYGIEEIASYYRSYLELMRHWDAVLPGRVLRVIYDDLVDDLDAEVRRLLGHCDLAFEPSSLEFHRTQRSVNTPSSEQVRQPIYRDGLTDWRKYEPWLDPLKHELGDALANWRK
jgi:tetratricopeptide (TPR) repeat protein